MLNNKKGYICTQWARQINQLFFRKFPVKKIIKPAQNCSGIAASSPETCRNRNFFPKLYF
ncbi:MAG: hypothetical protein WBB23_13435 [Desulforhopalus sp.]